MRLDAGQIEVVDNIMAEVLRHKTPAERLHISFNLWESSYRMLKAHLGKTHPEWDTQQLEKELARRFSHGAV